MKKLSALDLTDLRLKVLANARGCWCSFVAWDHLSRSRESSEIASLFYSTKWQFLPFEGHLFEDVLLRLVVLFDDKDLDQVSFGAYRARDSSFPVVEPEYAAVIARVRCIRHNAIAHWNAQENLSGWLAKFQLRVEDIELLFACIRKQHDLLLSLELSNPPDTFRILENRTRASIEEFIGVLRDSAKYKLVDPESKDRADKFYEIANL